MNVSSSRLDQKEVPRDLYLLLIISGLYCIATALSNTFVNIFLWKRTNSFIDIGLYNLMIVIFQPITFIFAGMWAKRVDRVIVLRAGVVVLSLFFISVLVLGSDSRQFFYLFGALIGMGYGFYWCAFNVLIFEITEPETRVFFNGIQGVLTSLGGMIGPILAGWIISSMKNYNGYRVIFGISLGLFALAVVVSWFLQRRPAEGKLTFRRILRERSNNENWRDILNAHFFQGAREGTFLFIIFLWVYLSTDNELAIGKFGLVESGVMFIGYYVVSRLIKPSFKKTSILIGGIITYGTVYILLFNVNYTMLIVYAVLVAIAYPLLFVPYASLTFDVIGHGWKAADMRIEYIVVKEIFYNAGRIVSVLLFLATVWYFRDDQQGIRYLMMVIGAGHLAIYFCIRRIPIPLERARAVKEGESGSTV
ncbi:MFS transporter [Pullulanibacillus sp. KACC 23026]|uniref:MFS transporter n=1 Tax=Pullulanibacillus sp. KACC 23026 TaxID=3028315 RepID=UPI0023B19568|nr:MFS transporter [Pullulanibacillus sp. KACC 23026]WEG14261.1 MFS transporter [Pullulanibacillus sp. KACC 23026]